jgi:hypothetical protein
MVAEDLAIK